MKASALFALFHPTVHDPTSAYTPAICSKDDIYREMFYNHINKETKIKRTRKRVNALYWPTCGVCIYMRQHKAFSEQVLLSTYFYKKGEKAITEVLKEFKDPFPAVNFYQHANRHMKGNLDHWRRVNKLDKVLARVEKEELKAKTLVDQTMVIVEEPTIALSEHEQALDEFIAKGREKLKYNNLPITSTTYIQAIKAKAEIENKTKDRRFDALKTLFSGAAPKEDEAKTV